MACVLDLCRLDGMIGRSRAGRRMIDSTSTDSSSTPLPMRFRSACTVRPMSRAESVALLAQQSLQRSRCEVMHHHPAGDTAQECLDIRAVIGRGHRGRVREADAVHEPHIHVHDLKTLLGAFFAGNHLGVFRGVGHIPQAIRAGRSRVIRAAQVRFPRGLARNIGRELVHDAIFNFDGSRQRPGQSPVQPRIPDIDRLAEAS